MLTLISAPRTRLRRPNYPVEAVFPLSGLASSVTIKAVGNSVEFIAPIHYPRTPEASRQLIAKRDAVEHGRSYDIPKEVVEPIIESWYAFSRTWSFNAPWWGGSVAQLALAVEVVKPKRLKESTDLLSYAALKYAIEEYIEANYHHTYINNKKLVEYSGPEQWSVSKSLNSPYISLSMLQRGGHTRQILNFIPLSREYFLCFSFELYRGGKAIGEPEVEKQIPAAPMLKLLNKIMASVQIIRKDAQSPENSFSDKKFIEDANAAPISLELSMAGTQS